MRFESIYQLITTLQLTMAILKVFFNPVMYT